MNPNPKATSQQTENPTFNLAIQNIIYTEQTIDARAFRLYNLFSSLAMATNSDNSVLPRVSCPASQAMTAPSPVRLAHSALSFMVLRPLIHIWLSLVSSAVGCQVLHNLVFVYCNCEYSLVFIPHIYTTYRLCAQSVLCLRQI
jgi:hypothetical protein